MARRGAEYANKGSIAQVDPAFLHQGPTPAGRAQGRSWPTAQYSTEKLAKFTGSADTKPVSNGSESGFGGWASGEASAAGADWGN